MDKPLWELHELLKDTTLYGEEELQDAMNTVLEAGEADRKSVV